MRGSKMWRRAGVPIALVLALVCATPAGAVPAAGSTASGSTTSITVAGAATVGHTFSAFRVAGYGQVSTDAGGRPVGVALVTATPALKKAVGAQVARIQAATAGDAPAQQADGTLDGLDPFQWVAENWPQTSSTGDLWGNPSPTTGPLRDLADWLGATVLTDPATFGLVEASQTGARTGGTPAATFSDVTPGLYAVSPPARSGDAASATTSPTLLVGTQIPVGGAFYDLYDDDGQVTRALGVVNVKGDAVTVTKTLVGDPASFAGGDAVMMVIETALPHFDLFDSSAPVRFEITDTHSSGLGEPDWRGVDARVADPILTVGTTTLHFDEACAVGLANTADPCFAVSGAVTDPATGAMSWTVGLPDWVARTHGGDAVFLTFEQLLTPAPSSADTLTPTRDTNRADVTFSHDPAHPQDVTTLGGAEVAAFTFPLRVTKVDAASGKPLAGVEFQVSTGETGSTTHCFAPDDDGTYWHTGTTPCATGSQTRLTTNAGGTLTVHGLAGNTAHTVVETKQPAGYAPSNLQVVRFTARANATLTPDRLHLSEVDYAFTNAGTARHLDSFLTTTTSATSVPTSAGNEPRTLTTAGVTVKNWVKGPQAATGGFLHALGADARTGVAALGLLVASGVLFAIAARQRRRQAGHVAAAPATPPATAAEPTA